MLGLMQDWPLLTSKIIEHAATWNGAVEIVTLRTEGDEHRYTYKDCQVRSKKLAQALGRRGVKNGDCIGTLAWNTYRHMEVWYGVGGMGAVAHTINPRLFLEQITYIINHAEDKVLFVDLTFVPLIIAIKAQVLNLKNIIIMTDEAHMPETPFDNILCYETLIDGEDGEYDWPELDENTACGLCYTSGTTGNPKGVLFSHRSTFLHTLCTLMKDTISTSASDVSMPIVPMFHANAWGVPFAAAASGAKLVFNGPNYDPEVLYNLMEREKVTQSAAVPTVWLGLLAFLKKTGKKLNTLNFTVIGGSAAPKSMIKSFQEDYGVTVAHAWGMTEMSPMGTVGSMSNETSKWSPEDQLDLKCKQGRPVLGVELKITDDDGNKLPHDGKSFGHLIVRGAWIAKSYFKEEGGEILDKNGWVGTGDVATIDEYGFMQITDRSKDVIKSGGEWISSIDIENTAVAHPDIMEAAVIGVFHPKWDERPLLICVMEEGKTLDKEAILSFLDGKIAKWWLPNDVVAINEIPHTATGKILKRELREMFQGYKLPTA